MANSLVFNNQAEEILDLGMHAFADTFIPLDKLDSSEPVYQLACILDPLTGMINNKIILKHFSTPLTKWTRILFVIGGFTVRTHITVICIMFKS